LDFCLGGGKTATINQGSVASALDGAAEMQQELADGFRSHA
jgi:hypothetical protein